MPQTATPPQAATPAAGSTPPSTAQVGLRSFTDSLQRESDRACAVLAGAFLDATLEDFFRAQMVARVPGTLFDVNGVLRSFSAKIDVAYSLGWISRSEAADLHTVRKIRDAFARATGPEIDFTLDAVRDRCAKLDHTNAFLRAAQSTGGAFLQQAIDEIANSPRRRFEVSIGFLRQALVYRMSIARHAHSPTSLMDDPDVAMM